MEEENKSYLVGVIETLLGLGIFIFGVIFVCKFIKLVWSIPLWGL